MGSLLPQKGYLSLLEGFRLFHEHHPSSELHLFGGGDGAVVTPQEGVTFHGNYQPGDIPTILSLFDVGIIPSIFAETFCLVLSELWHAGRAVGASRIGALKERITDGVNGRLFTPGNPGEIAQTLEWFTTNESWRKWEVPEVRLLDAMIGEYQTLYRSMVK